MRIITLPAILLALGADLFAENLPSEGASNAAQLSAFEMKLGRLLPGAMPASLSVSPDRKHVAFFRKSIDGKSWSLILDDAEGDPYDAVGKMNPRFSPDSQRVAYVAMKKRRKLVVVDGVEGREYNEIGGLTFSPNSKHVAYMASEGAERFVVLDGMAQPLRFDGLHASGPIFSPDSQRLGYVAKVGIKWLVVIDGKQGREYDGAGGLIFSPDSQHWAHFGQRGKTSLVILDGIESPKYDGILRDTSLVFTTPYTVEALVHRNLEIRRVAFTGLLK